MFTSTCPVRLWYLSCCFSVLCVTFCFLICKQPNFLFHSLSSGSTFSILIVLLEVVFIFLANMLIFSYQFQKLLSVSFSCWKISRHCAYCYLLSSPPKLMRITWDFNFRMLLISYFLWIMTIWISGCFTVHTHIISNYFYF